MVSMDLAFQRATDEATRNHDPHQLPKGRSHLTAVFPHQLRRLSTVAILAQARAAVILVAADARAAAPEQQEGWRQ